MSPSHPEGQQYFGQCLSILMDRSRWRLRRPFLPVASDHDLSSRGGRQLVLAEALRFAWIPPDFDAQSTWQFEQDTLTDFLTLLSLEPATVLTLAPAQLSDLIGPLRRPSFDHPLAAFYFDPPAFNRLVFFMGMAFANNFELGRLHSFRTAVPTLLDDFASRLRDGNPLPGAAFAPKILRADLTPVNRALNLCPPTQT